MFVDGLFEFTPETIEKIKDFDSEAIKRFYLANYDFFKTLVNKYIRYRYLSTTAYDLNFNEFMNDIYVSLPYYNYSSVQLFVVTVKYSFKFVKFGGLAYLKEHNRSMITKSHLVKYDSLYYENDDGDMYLKTDFLQNQIDESYINDFSIDEIEIEKIYQFCSKYLSDRQKQVFYYLLEGYSRKEIVKKLNISNKNYDAIILFIREKLIINFKEIKEFLYKNDFEISPYYDNLYLEFYNNIQAKIDRRRQNQREHYAKNKKVKSKVAT